MMLLGWMALALIGLAGLLIVSVSLSVLDQRLAELVQAMQGRYGAWMDHRQADEKKQSKDTKEVRKDAIARAAAPGKSG